MRTFILALLMLGVLSPAYARDCKALSDAQIRAAIVSSSRQAYYATGHPCACPDDRDRRGHACGGRSAHSRLGGADPRCSLTDVTAADIAAYCR